jgi:VIT1/CCC1 family predicted Fe2+/Mn2+ transporter
LGIHATGKAKALKATTDEAIRLNRGARDGTETTPLSRATALRIRSAPRDVAGLLYRSNDWTTADGSAILGVWPLSRIQTRTYRMEQTPLTQEPQSEAPPPPTLSLAGRLLNVFATPGDVFQEIKTASVSPANWLVPAVILILVSWTAAWLIFSQEPIRHQLSEITDRAIQKQVESGRLSEQQAEQARAMGEKWAGISSKIGAGLVPVFSGFVTPFFWGLILWLAGAKGLKGSFSYMKAVEVVGLANMVTVLDVIVKTLLIVGLGNLYAAPGLVLLVKDFDPQNPVHSLLALVNVMTFWLLAVRALGLARLSGASFVKAALWVFGIWAAYTGFFIGLGFLAQSVFKRMGA